MKNPAQLINTTAPVRTSLTHPPLRRGVLLLLLGLSCALLPTARATCQNGCLLNENTALGDDALISLTTGTDNTAVGFNALFNNTEGSFNTATGSGALFQNTTGVENTGYGWNALSNNTTGVANTAVGVAALLGMNGGTANAAFGESALGNTTTGNDNTAIGAVALINNSAGSNNIAIGRSAGQNLTTGDNNIEIGNKGARDESNTIRIGTSGTQTATFVAGIRGVPINGGATIGVNANGQLGVKPSSARYKEAIKPMGEASEALLELLLAELNRFVQNADDLRKVLKKSTYTFLEVSALWCQPSWRFSPVYLQAARAADRKPELAFSVHQASVDPRLITPFSAEPEVEVEARARAA
jgi:hypothetical protein